jgi:flagellar hook-associated protein 3 FlgL
MRISTKQLQLLGTNAILQQQAELSDVQLQLATGKRILHPSDDPFSSTKATAVKEGLSVTRQYQENINIAVNRLSLSESTLASANTVLQRIRELALQANNDSSTTGDREILATEVRRRLDELLSLANSKDANGEYIFSGFKGSTRPYTQLSDGSFSYNGDQGQRFLQISQTRQLAVTESGHDTFSNIKNGNGTFTIDASTSNSGTGIIDQGSVDGTFISDTYTISFVTNSAGELAYTVSGATSGQLIPPLPAAIPANAPAYEEGAEFTFNGVSTSIKGTPVVGDTFTVSPSTSQDVFTTVQNLINTLESGAINPDARALVHNEINAFLVDVDQAMDNLVRIRASVGSRLNTAEDQQNTNEDGILNQSATLSKIEDLDYAEAVSRFNLQKVGLEAAQQAYIRVQGLSLFNYLR